MAMTGFRGPLEATADQQPGGQSRSERESGLGAVLSAGNANAINNAGKGFAAMISTS